MICNKLNFGAAPRVAYDRNPTRRPTSIEDYKQLIRDAHARGQLSDIKIKDWSVVRDYLVARDARRQAAKGKAILPLAQRLRQRLINLSPNDHTSRCWLRNGYVTSYHPGERLWVIQCDDDLVTAQKTWYYHAAWLCGRDDGHYFTHRIPARISRVSEALEWIRPAAVTKAIAAGKRTLRQGDVWFVESRFRSDNTRAIPWGHDWDSKTRNCVHAEHGTLHIPFSFRAYTNKGVGGGPVD